MDTIRLCPQCQQPLSADAPDGLCPQCLMRAASGPPPSASSDGLAGDIIDIGDPAEVAKKLPQFEILEMLGRGGMGVVYKARQRNLDRIVALKILPPVDALSPDFVARFSREARALAKLNHPNIVNVHDFGETGGLYFIVMEYVDGTNLRQLFQARRLTPAEALAIVPKICDALEYAHEEGLVHRDIKPENLLLDKKGRVKIADFGLAKLLRREPLDMTLTLSGMALGTLRYMAPEQMDKPETVDHRADLYSLGVVIYEMLTGETPVGRFELPSQKAQVDVRFDEIVLHALEKEPARRYQHASEVKTDVENVSSKPQPMPIPTSGMPVAPPSAAENLAGPDVESEAARCARASWFGQRSERFRTLLPPALIFLEIVFILASFPGWPTPWLETKWHSMPHNHGVADSSTSYAFHPLTFSFFLFMAGLACAFLAARLSKMDHLVRYGRRFRELRKEIHRPAKLKIVGFGAIAFFAPVLIAGFFAVIASGGLHSTAVVSNLEFRLGPNSKAYEELLVDMPFYSTIESGVEHYRRPNQWDMAIGLKTKNSAEPVTMDIEMPSLRASYVPSWSKDYEKPIVLDLDELTKWMSDGGKLDVKDEKVKKEAGELMALLKRFIRQAPVNQELGGDNVRYLLDVPNSLFLERIPVG